VFQIAWPMASADSFVPLTPLDAIIAH
jgi:hypothetical protein